MPDAELVSVERAYMPGATHLFEEPAALERVSHLALQWSRRHVGVRLP